MLPEKDLTSTTQRIPSRLMLGIIIGLVLAIPISGISNISNISSTIITLGMPTHMPMAMPLIRNTLHHYQ